MRHFFSFFLERNVKFDIIRIQKKINVTREKKRITAYFQKNILRHRFNIHYNFEKTFCSFKFFNKRSFNFFANTSDFRIKIFIISFCTQEALFSFNTKYFSNTQKKLILKMATQQEENNIKLSFNSTKNDEETVYGSNSNYLAIPPIMHINPVTTKKPERTEPYNVVPPLIHININPVTTKKTKKTERTEPYKKKSKPHKEFNSKENKKPNPVSSETSTEVNNNNSQDIIRNKSDHFDFDLDDDFELFSGSSSPEISEEDGSCFFPPLNSIGHKSPPPVTQPSGNDNLNQGTPPIVDQLPDSTIPQCGYLKGTLSDLI